jgi:hypothetical protein
MPASFTKSRFMLCEGDDDKRVFEAVISQRGLPEFQIVHAAEWCGSGGRGAFKKVLKDVDVLSGFNDLTGLLLVSDNDALNTAFAEVCDALTCNGYTAPNEPETVGRIKDKPAAVLMVPSHGRVGDLEALCLPAIHEKWPKAADCVEDFLRCSGALNWQKTSSLSKARARAVPIGFNEEDPYKGIGILFERRVLSATHACFDRFAEFLKDFDAFCGIV